MFAIKEQCLLVWKYKLYENTHKLKNCHNTQKVLEHKGENAKNSCYKLCL